MWGHLNSTPCNLKSCHSQRMHVWDCLSNANFPSDLLCLCRNADECFQWHNSWCKNLLPWKLHGKDSTPFYIFMNLFTCLKRLSDLNVQLSQDGAWGQRPVQKLLVWLPWQLFACLNPNSWVDCITFQTVFCFELHGMLFFVCNDKALLTMFFYWYLITIARVKVTMKGHDWIGTEIGYS